MDMGLDMKGSATMDRRRLMLLEEDLAAAQVEPTDVERWHSNTHLRIGDQIFPRGCPLPDSVVSQRNFGMMKRSGQVVLRVPSQDGPRPHAAPVAVLTRQPLLLKSDLSNPPHEFVDALRASVDAELSAGAESLAHAIDRSRMKNAGLWERAQRAASAKRAGKDKFRRPALDDRELLGLPS
jgi:hypothetical protein